MNRRACLPALLLLAGVPAAASGPAQAPPVPASVTIAGGVSLGAYEAGLAYYAVELLRANAGMTEVKLATGASAGSVNSLLTLLQACSTAVPDPRQSLFWKTWIPLGLAGVTRPGTAVPTAAFSQSAFDEPVALVRASAGDDFGTDSCPHPTSDEVGSCSRPVLGLGVAATALERVRLQLMFDYYFRTRTGNVAWWAVAPGIGLQW